MIYKSQELFKVEFYETEEGEIPVKEFLLSLSKRVRAKTMRLITLLEKEGNNLRMPYSKELEEGIFELRTEIAGVYTRVLYFFVINKQIILTNGFVKKQKKTPKSELDLAKKYRKDYLRRRK